MTRHSHFAALRRMLELSVTSSLSHLSPAVAFDQLDHHPAFTESSSDE
jgi:hypothetical protein